MYSFNWGNTDDFFLTRWYHQAIVVHSLAAIRWLTLHDNSHLLASEAAVSWAIFYVFGINFKILVYSSAILLYWGSILLTALVWRDLSSWAGRSLALIVPLIMIFHPVQSQALLWAFEIGWFMVTFALVANTFVIERYGQAGLPWVVVICAVASLSSAHGVFLWLAAMLQIRLFPEIRRRRLWFGVFLLGFCLGALAIATLTSPESGGIRQGPMRLADVWQIGVYVVGLIGSVFGSWPLGAVWAFGLVGLALVATWCWLLRRSTLRSVERAGIVLIAASLMFVAAFALGRFRLGLPWALWDNHAGPMLAPFVCGLGLLAIEGIGGRSARPMSRLTGFVTLIVCLVSVVASAPQAVALGQESLVRRVLAMHESCEPTAPPILVERLNGLGGYPWMVEEDARTTDETLPKMDEVLPLVRHLCTQEEPEAAREFESEPSLFLTLAAEHPDHARALSDLWSVYLTRYDLLRALPVSSPEMPKLLLAWAHDDAEQADSSEPVLLGPHRTFFIRTDPK